MRVLVWLIVGVIVGAVAALMGHRGRGSQLATMMAAGVVGALAGGMLGQRVAVAVQPSFGGESFAALVGAIVVTAICSLTARSLPRSA